MNVSIWTLIWNENTGIGMLLYLIDYWSDPTDQGGTRYKENSYSITEINPY